jgi:dihydrofolate reductase
MGLAGRIYLTRVHARLACDVFFPSLDGQEWVVTEEQFLPADEQNEWPTTYQVLERMALL